MGDGSGGKMANEERTEEDCFGKTLFNKCPLVFRPPFFRHPQIKLFYDWEPDVPSLTAFAANFFLFSRRCRLRSISRTRSIFLCFAKRSPPN